MMSIVPNGYTKVSPAGTICKCPGVRGPDSQGFYWCCDGSVTKHRQTSVTHLDERGTPRQAHYGAGRQPWDDVLDAGWAPEFCAGNVLKYLRRDKERQHSVESARWYYRRLVELSRGEIRPSGVSPYRQDHPRRAQNVWKELHELLTLDELTVLTRREAD
jgi:hypothetical protein